MRPIPSSRIAVFSLFVGFLGAAMAGAAWGLSRCLDGGAFRGFILLAGAGFTGCAGALIAFRLLWRVLPVREGKVRPGTRNEWAYHLYILFNLLFFYPLTRSAFLPLPLMRLLYLLLGARLGENTFPSGLILDPPLTEVGANTIIGQGAILAAHNLVTGSLFHQKIVVGSDVTIGGQAMIAAGARIEAGALIGPGAFVGPLCTIGRGATIHPNSFLKAGTRVRAGETWGGVPAVKAGSEGLAAPAAATAQAAESVEVPEVLWAGNR